LTTALNKDRAVFIGLDSCDPAIALTLAENGKMPNLAGLLREGARVPVRNPHGLFVGALWANFQTAMSAARHGFFCWEKIDPKTYQYELVTPDLERHPNFWSRLSAAGKSVAVIDVPHSRGVQPVNGFEVIEWGAHDKHFGFRTNPPELAQSIVSNLGFHPTMSGDKPTEMRNFAPDDMSLRKGILRTPAEDVALSRALVEGVRLKAKLVNSLFEAGDHDLFLAVFGESHAVGHQLWHMHDPKHPRHDPATVEEFGGDPLEAVYAELDQAVGETLKRTDPDRPFMLLLSHGIGPHYDGTHLLPDILQRLQFGFGSEQHQEQDGERSEAGREASFLARIARPYLPALKAVARKLRLPTFLRRLGSRHLTVWEQELHRRASGKFYMQHNNTAYGGIRLNLAGREPNGCVDPADADAEIAWLEGELLKIRCEESGKPLIRNIERSDRWHARNQDDEIPDLFIDWDRSVLPATVSSPAIGTLTFPYHNWRTGDHRPAGMLLVRSHGLAGGSRLAPVNTEDLGPTIAAYLKTVLPEVEGRIAPWAPQPAEDWVVAREQKVAA
jgi:predicted AlkP superfamily phosphohydrolase/phosphomutase